MKKTIEKRRIAVNFLATITIEHRDDLSCRLRYEIPRYSINTREQLGREYSYSTSNAVYIVHAFHSRLHKQRGLLLPMCLAV